MDKETYISYKYILALVLNSNEIDSIEDLIEVELLELFRDILKLLVNNGFIDEIVKENLYKFLSKGREILDDKKNERIKIINEIITILNNSNEDESLIFYREQLTVRSGNKKYLSTSNIDEIKKRKSIVNFSTMYDFLILKEFDDENNISEEDFVKRYLKDQNNCEIFLGSISIIIEECPFILKDEKVYNMFKYALNSLNKDDIKHNKKVLKLINKKLKK